MEKIPREDDDQKELRNSTYEADIFKVNVIVCSIVMASIAASAVFVKLNNHRDTGTDSVVQKEKLEIVDLGDGQYIAKYLMPVKERPLCNRSQLSAQQNLQLISLARTEFEKSMPAIKIKDAYLINREMGPTLGQGMAECNSISVRITTEGRSLGVK